MVVRIINLLVSFIIQKRTCKDLKKRQWYVLKQQLKYSEKSALGQKYDFKNIKSIEEYQQKVPVHEYSDIEPYWEKEAHGVLAQTVNEEIEKFVYTSGTTGTKKLIPVTSMILKNMKRSHLFFTARIVQLFPQCRILMKKILVVASRSYFEDTKGGKQVGMISGVMHDSTSILLRPLFLPKNETNNIADPEEKFAQIAIEAKGKKIGVIGGIPAFVLKLIGFIKDTYTNEEFSFFCANLEVIITSGTNYRLYKKQFERLIGHEVKFYDIYTASEGALGYQSLIHNDEMEFFDDMVFFEFIQTDDFNTRNFSKRYLIDQLKKGEHYNVLITTGNGTFSYSNGDIIECVDPAVPTFRIIGRSTEDLNMTAEKTNRYIVEQVIEQVSNDINCSPAEFFVTGVSDKKQPHYLWVFEKKGKWAKYPAEYLAEILDNKLKDANALYQFARDHTLGQSQVLFVNSEKFEHWHKKIQSDPYHHKIPKIINNPEMVESIIGGSIPYFS